MTRPNDIMEMEWICELSVPALAACPLQLPFCESDDSVNKFNVAQFIFFSYSNLSLSFSSTYQLFHSVRRPQQQPNSRPLWLQKMLTSFLVESHFTHLHCIAIQIKCMLNYVAHLLTWMKQLKVTTTRDPKRLRQRFANSINFHYLLTWAQYNSALDKNHRSYTRALCRYLADLLWASNTVSLILFCTRSAKTNSTTRWWVLESVNVIV